MWSKEHAQSLLQMWRASGQSIAAFCREQGIAAHRLRYWRRQLGAEASNGDHGNAAAAGFVQIVERQEVDGPGADRWLLRWPSGVELSGRQWPDAHWLRVLITAEPQPC